MHYAFDYLYILISRKLLLLLLCFVPHAVYFGPSATLNVYV